MGRAAAFCRAAFKLLVALLLALLALHAGISAMTAQQYFAGTVRAAGYPSNYKFESEITNLHPKYRVPCALADYTQLTRARLRTLDFLVRWFGPVPGSYQGPYPDRETAWAVARSAWRSVPPTALLQPLVVDGQAIRLSLSDLRSALPQLSFRTYDSDLPVALKLFEGTCLLIGRWSGPNYRVELIDTSRIGWFARYEYDVVNMYRY
jgi:hypothetical protein